MPRQGYVRIFFFCALFCLLSFSIHAQQNQPQESPLTGLGADQPSVHDSNLYPQPPRETQHPVYYPPPSSVRTYDEPSSPGPLAPSTQAGSRNDKNEGKNLLKNPTKERVIYTKDITKDTLATEPVKISISLPESRPQVALTCPNGIIDPGEDCDGGSCCDEHCKFRALGIPCDDGDAGTINDVCGPRGRCGGFLPGGGCLSHCSYRPPTTGPYDSLPGSGCGRAGDTTQPYSRCSLSPFFVGPLPPLLDPFLLGLTGLIFIRWWIRNRKD